MLLPLTVCLMSSCFIALSDLQFVKVHANSGLYKFDMHLSVSSYFKWFFECVLFPERVQKEEE